MLMNYCSEKGEWDLRDRPCKEDPSSPCEGDGCFSFQVMTRHDGMKMVILANALKRVYARSLDGDDFLKLLSLAYEKALGVSIDG